MDCWLQSVHSSFTYSKTHTPPSSLSVRGRLMSLRGVLGTQFLGVVQDNYPLFKASSVFHLLDSSIVSLTTEHTAKGLYTHSPARPAECIKSRLSVQVLFPATAWLNSYSFTCSHLEVAQQKHILSQRSSLRKVCLSTQDTSAIVHEGRESVIKVNHIFQARALVPANPHFDTNHRV